MMTFSDPHQDKILIVDFGSQYTQLIGRVIRELGVYCEIMPYDAADAALLEFAPKGVILSGGPASVYDAATPRANPLIFNWNVPILGICYGMQTLIAQLGGDVESAAEREFGHAVMTLTQASELLGSAADNHDVWMSHGDRVLRMPEGFEVLATTANSPYAAVADTQRHYYGFQFHPEVTHSAQGRAYLSHFVHQICGCENAWVSDNIIESQIQRVREQVGEDEVILGLSGGVDSSVVAALLHKAIGKQLTCIFVDHGLLRLNEGDQVMQTFAEHLGVRVIRVDAAEQFFAALAGVADPEQKRKIIGKLFVEIFQQQAAALKNAKWLAQGTIYPDVIESAGNKHGKAKVIKSHHNVGGLPEDMTLKLVEPLRELFKDEVRRIGLALGLPATMVMRHPFPGPGLGVRILGEVKAEYVSILQFADAIFIEELRNNDLYDSTSQAFAVFLPVKSVGVVGDNRAYEYVIALRAVETIDFMTANWKEIPFKLLGHISNRIINEVKGISRVTYDISGKPPATIEWE